MAGRASGPIAEADGSPLGFHQDGRDAAQNSSQFGIVM